MARFATEKEQAHELIERLAPSQVSAIVNVLQAMLDPVAKAIATAPIDDEPESQEERSAVNESKESLRQNGGNSTEQVMAELGLNSKDLKPRA